MIIRAASFQKPIVAKGTKRLKGCIFDAGGTIVDPGCKAPLFALLETFKKEGVNLSINDVRSSMGHDKKSHISKILQSRAIDLNVDKLYNTYKPIQLEILKRNEHQQATPGAVSSIMMIKDLFNMKIGITTGYNREMLNIILNNWTSKYDIEFDVSVGSDEVLFSRPDPEGCNAIMDGMNIVDPLEMVKIGDTIPDILEGRNAGMWTVGVSKYSSTVGLGVEHLLYLEQNNYKEYERILIMSKKELRQAGAHYVVDELSDLYGVLKDINRRVEIGENPY